MRNQVVRCFKAMMRRQDLPEIPSEDDKFNRNVSFFEASTESLAQFTLSNIILRVYGISDDLTAKILQFFSLISSMLTLQLAFFLVSLIK